MSNVITDEACLTNAIGKFSLDAPPSGWAKALAILHSKGRINSTNQIKKLGACGYDINIQACKIMNFYESSNSNARLI